MSLDQFRREFSDILFFSPNFEKVPKFVVYITHENYKKKTFEMNKLLLGPFYLKNLLFYPTHIVCLWMRLGDNSMTFYFFYRVFKKYQNS